MSFGTWRCVFCQSGMRLGRRRFGCIKRPSASRVAQECGKDRGSPGASFTNHEFVSQTTAVDVVPTCGRSELCFVRIRHHLLDTTQVVLDILLTGLSRALAQQAIGGKTWGGLGASFLAEVFWPERAQDMADWRERSHLDRWGTLDGDAAIATEERRVEKEDPAREGCQHGRGGLMLK